jgi:hypothetical protein
MGRSIIPIYRVEYQDYGSRTAWHSMCWKGRATAARLEQWRRDYNKSFNPGGVNWHVSQSLGYVLHITKARLVHQATGTPVAFVNMPMFEVV